MGEEAEGGMQNTEGRRQEAVGDSGCSERLWFPNH